MKHTRIALFVAVAALSPCAHAADDWQVNYNVGAQSDYIFRGISQTDRRSSGFAGVDATWRGSLYAGAWTSNVDFSPSGDRSTDQEYDLYGGWRPHVAGFDLDLGYIRYGYMHQPKGLRETYVEWYAKASRAFGPVTVGVAAYHSPDFPGIVREANYGEVNVAWTFVEKWSLSGAYGRQHEQHASMRADGTGTSFIYNTWNAGVTWQFDPRVSLDLRYWNTDAHGAGDIYHAHLVAGIKAVF